MMNSYWVKYAARNYMKSECYEGSCFIHDITPEELEDWCEQRNSFAGGTKDFVIEYIISIVKL